MGAFGGGGLGGKQFNHLDNLPKLASNYLPVSLSSIASKAMEHIISSQAKRRLDINDVHHYAQHGFRKIRLCETQLLLNN